MRTAADRIPDSEFVLLPGSHFVQLEHPERVLHQLLWLVAQG
jgi:pimeloyl-ACP methyl ester carboxylesterase